MTADEPMPGRSTSRHSRSDRLADFPFEQNRIRLAYGMWLRRQRRPPRHVRH